MVKEVAINTGTMAHALMYLTPGHVYCECGRILKYENPDTLIGAKSNSFVKQKSDPLTTTAFVPRNGQGRGRRHGLSQEQQTKNETYRASQTIGWTEKTEMNDLALQDDTSHATRANTMRYWLTMSTSSVLVTKKAVIHKAAHFAALRPQLQLPAIHKRTNQLHAKCALRINPESDW